MFQNKKNVCIYSIHPLLGADDGRPLLCWAVIINTLCYDGW